MALNKLRAIGKKLENIIEPAVNLLGFELVGCEVHQFAGKNIVRVYVDCERGVTIEDCAEVSRQVSAALDVEDPVVGRYDLEVSSPGLNRPLMKLEHFQRFIGHKVKVKLRRSRDNRRNYTGVIQAVKGNEVEIVLENNEESIVLLFAEIKKANLVPER